MNNRRRSPGELIDVMATNARRLAVANAALGVASAFHFLSRPGIYHPSLHALASTRGSSLEGILHSLLAWIPYVVSWFISRAALSYRDKNATLAFIACAIAITGISFAIEFPASGALNFSTLLFSGVITISLAIACGICTIPWRRNTSI